MEAESQDFDEDLDNDETSSDYDYDSDSDLEDDRLTMAKVLKGVLNKVVPSKETVKDTLRRTIPQKDTLKKALRVDSICCLGGETPQEPPLHEEYSERLHKGKVVTIPDVAFVT